MNKLFLTLAIIAGVLAVAFDAFISNRFIRNMSEMSDKQLAALEQLVQANEATTDKIPEVRQHIEVVKQLITTSNERSKSLPVLIILADIVPYLLIFACIYALYKGVKTLQNTKSELIRLHSLQNAILETTDQAIITLDLDGNITSFNKGAEVLTGFSSAEVLSKPISQFFDEIDNTIHAKKLSDRYSIPFHDPFELLVYVSKNNLKDEIVWTIMSKNEQKVFLLVTFGPLIDDKGTTYSYLLEGTDITNRLKHEEELRIAHKKAEDLSKAKSRFITNMSHDLRTPLNSIIGFSSIMQQNKLGNFTEKDLNFISRIEESGKVLLGLIDNIVDIERIEEQKVSVVRTEVDLAATLNAIVHQLDYQAQKKNISIKLEMPDPLQPLFTDSAKLTQILNNLIGNAIKFTEQGGVTIKVQKDTLTNVPNKIDIIDTGIGIEKSKFSKIFESYYQVETNKGRYAGSGLGLAISQAYCEALGYQIIVKSEVGKGSTFSLLFMPTNNLSMTDDAKDQGAARTSV